MTNPAGSTPLHASADGGVGPLSMLAACLLPVAGAVAIDSTRQGLLSVGAETLLLGWMTRDVRSTLRRLALGLVAATSIMVSTWLYGGRHLDESFGAALRILAIVGPAAVLTPLIRPSELGDHLAQRLHLPARVVVAAVAALQRVESIADQWRQVQQARRSRGLGLDGGPVRRVKASAAGAFALLVVAMRRTGAMAVAMDARGFATATDRTWAEAAPWGWRDSALLLIAIVLAVFPWLMAGDR